MELLAERALVAAVGFAVNAELGAREEPPLQRFELTYADVRVSTVGTFRASEGDNFSPLRGMRCGIETVDDERLRVLSVVHGEALDRGRSHTFSIEEGRVTHLTTRTIRSGR